MSLRVPHLQNQAHTCIRSWLRCISRRNLALLCASLSFSALSCFSAALSGFLLPPRPSFRLKTIHEECRSEQILKTYRSRSRRDSARSLSKRAMVFCSLRQLVTVAQHARAGTLPYVEFSAAESRSFRCCLSKDCSPSRFFCVSCFNICFSLPSSFLFCNDFCSVQLR